MMARHGRAWSLTLAICGRVELALFLQVHRPALLSLPHDLTLPRPLTARKDE